MVLTKEEVVEVCKTIEDPELFMDIYTLGLIYEININESPKIISTKDESGNEVKESEPELHILMTFTTPMCPYGPQMVGELKLALERQGADMQKTKIEVTFDPPWKPSDELRDMMGI